MRGSPRIGEYFIYDLDTTQEGAVLQIVGIERPYDATRLLWRGQRFVAVLVKAHRGYWSQQAHYIPAECQVVEIMGRDGRGLPFVARVWEQVTGRKSRAVQAEAIAEAKRREDGR